MQVVCVTDRRRCAGPFLDQVARLAAARPDAVLLREKDLSPEAYLDLARACRRRCAAAATPLIVHGHADVAARLGDVGLHLSLAALTTRRHRLGAIARIGVSVHAVAEATAAEAWGADYLIAGHVFATACKPGLPPRGIGFLAEIAAAVSIPVLAIGGITPARLADIRHTGAAGVCVMSAAMTGDPAPLIAALRSDPPLETS